VGVDFNAAEVNNFELNMKCWSFVAKKKKNVFVFGSSQQRKCLLEDTQELSVWKRSSDKNKNENKQFFASVYSLSIR
jgi:hypothetical protein